MPEAKNYPYDKEFIGPFDDFYDTFNMQKLFRYMSISNLAKQRKEDSNP